MAVIGHLVRIKAALFPKLVLDRTPLDKRIEALLREREALLREIEHLRYPQKPAGTYTFQGYDIPIDLIMMTGGGTETFDVISAVHMHNLRRWIGLDSNHTLVEIGCGIGRDAIPLTEILTDGKYVGIDIIGRSIEWCKLHISPRHPNFQFYHFDVKDQIHNPPGVTATADIRLPVDDQSVDRIVLFSVFTHMLRGDIEHYLREFRRVLRPNGLVYATTFLFDDEVLASARATNLTPHDLRFEHLVEPGCRINDLTHPLSAVAFTTEAWDGMVERSGLKYAQRVLRGSWSGLFPEPNDGQDSLVLAPNC
ncbi:class I SAM-dependent methyltransferase [Rhizobium sp. BK399]|uniref:class I SAM-dependent methyltransferase n=1 Tax=Rhizobium sp. BK399 TaxID=2587063 RepID=UPI00161FDAF9|nr:class I SAM-dependent methyltransferase [Rhizobium sp. BK399]MBB3542449.1 SAM-dependent methyltransferase [Rhizobium sp. BK399]